MGHLLPMHLAHHPRALAGLLQESQFPKANSGTQRHEPQAPQQGHLGRAETRREGRLRVVLWGQGLEPGMKFLQSSGLSEERRGERAWGTLAEHRFDGSGLQRQASCHVSVCAQPSRANKSCWGGLPQCRLPQPHTRACPCELRYLCELTHLCRLTHS